MFSLSYLLQKSYVSEHFLLYKMPLCLNTFSIVRSLEWMVEHVLYVYGFHLGVNLYVIVFVFDMLRSERYSVVAL